MSSRYVRPWIAAREFHGAGGETIHYGDRWGMGGPPADAYSVVSHPERFASTHRIAEALVTHLTRTFAVEVSEDLAFVQDLRHPPPAATRAIRVTPTSAASASLTVVFTSLPAVHVHAGLLHDTRYPACGCDACDESWVSVASQLENNVLAVAAGQFRECVELRFDPWPRKWLTYSLGDEWGGASTQGIPKVRVRDARRQLRAMPDGWARWPARSASISPLGGSS